MNWKALKNSVNLSVYEKRAVYLLVILILSGAAWNWYQQKQIAASIELITSSNTATNADIEATDDEEIPFIVDINTASEKVLQSLPSIGPVLAQRIVVYREKYGPFNSVDDIVKVPGIGEKRLKNLRERITVTMPDRSMLE